MLFTSYTTQNKRQKKYSEGKGAKNWGLELSRSVEDRRAEGQHKVLYLTSIRQLKLE
jgi:hypothetical protein